MSRAPLPGPSAPSFHVETGQTGATDMARKQAQKKAQPKPETPVQVSPEMLKRITAAASDWKRNVENKRSAADDAEAKRIPTVSALTFEAMEAGVFTPGRKPLPGQETQGAYADRFGVKSGTVTRWRRIGRALSLGLDAESAHFKALTRVANDGPVGKACEEGTLAQVKKAIESRVDKTALARGEVRVLPRPKKAQAKDDKGPEVNLSAASVVEFFGLASATVVGSWEAWNLKPQTASALLDTLDGLREFVAEQTPKATSARSKRTA